MNLRKEITYHDTGKIYYICLIDKKGDYHGEYVEYKKNGSIRTKGFFKDGFFIGKYYYNEKYYFSSFINLGKYISEQEHKKELVMVRLGLIEVPELSYFIKDYDEKGKIN